MAIGDKKKALKASGMSGKQCDKDPEVVEMVARLQELKSQVRTAEIGNYSNSKFGSDVSANM